MVMRKHATCKRHGSDLNSKPNTMTVLFTKVGVFFLTKPMMHEEASGNTTKPLKDLTVQKYFNTEDVRLPDILKNCENRGRVPLCKGGAF